MNTRMSVFIDFYTRLQLGSLYVYSSENIFGTNFVQKETRIICVAENSEFF